MAGTSDPTDGAALQQGGAQRADVTVDFLRLMAEAEIKSACLEAASTIVAARAARSAMTESAVADAVAGFAFELYDEFIAAARRRRDKPGPAAGSAA